MQPISFALNHMTVPSLSLDAFMKVAADLDIGAIEIRNDLEGRPIIDGTPAVDVKNMAARYGLTIASINALQRFNEWTDEREAEARSLIAYARNCGAEALVLVPVCDGTGKEDGTRQANLRKALSALAPLLSDASVTGLVEPLGFEKCSLRFKAEAVEAIADTGHAGTFRLVHDTFHHHVADETAFFPEWTGLVHISGVDDRNVTRSDMLDAHRVLVDAADRLGNIEQMRMLISAGYRGRFSFEPFAAEIHALRNPEEALRNTISHIRENLRRA